MKNLFIVLTAILFFAACGKNPPSVPVTPVIISFTPQSGIVGASVSITGTNFADVNSVKFNGVAVTPSSTSATVISVQVPVNATTGNISVTSPGGTATSTDVFTVLPTPVPPSIIKVFPNNNAVNGPVLIEGSFQDIASIKFNGQVAPIDTVVTETATLSNLAIPLEANVTGIVTTRVPAGISAGPVSLTVTSKNGTSANYAFTVLGAPPASPIFPSLVKIKVKAKYIPAVENRWTNEFSNSNYIFIQRGSGGSLLGIENLTGPTDSFAVTHSPSSTDKTIEVTVTHSNGSKDKLSGIYADSDLLPADKPAWQRIIFYDKDGRQIVVHVQVIF